MILTHAASQGYSISWTLNSRLFIHIMSFRSQFQLDVPYKERILHTHI